VRFELAFFEIVLLNPLQKKSMVYLLLTINF